MKRERPSSTFGEMREKEGKKRGEILNEDGREIGWMKEIWKRRERIERKGEGDGNIFFFWNCNFYIWNRESKSPEGK
jgi:hypothetical protein